MSKEYQWPNFSEQALLGLLLTKIDFWANKRGYEFSFQFWGEGQNNVYIRKDMVDIADFGGEDKPAEILKIAIEWCEKANPRIKYPIKTIDV